MISYTYIYKYKYIFFQIIFHDRLLQDTEYSSLCYAEGPYLSILYTVACIAFIDTYCISGAEHFTRDMAHKFKWISAFMDLTAWGRGERRGNTKKRIMKINLEIVIIAINNIISEEWGYG